MQKNAEKCRNLQFFSEKVCVIQKFSVSLHRQIEIRHKFTQKNSNHKIKNENESKKNEIGSHTDDVGWCHQPLYLCECVHTIRVRTSSELPTSTDRSADRRWSIYRPASIEGGLSMYHTTNVTCDLVEARVIDGSFNDWQMIFGTIAQEIYK